LIDAQVQWAADNGKEPRKMKLPVRMAWDLAKCGRDEMGEISDRVRKDGIEVFEKEGLHGLNVEIVRRSDAQLQFE
jgi:hypothetical protein